MHGTLRCHARHNRTEELPTSTLRSIKPFLPPELIIQDELHLITGPLGTVYGAYETVIEDLCSYTIGEKKIKPKYVVSTATIKNAAEQTKCLYGRKVTAQFPPNGFEIGDSFYIREVPVEQDPFRRYVGVCAPGQSVKTALLRVYSIILQSAYNLSLDDEYKDVIDPYYTLVGYYNSIRELGGAVRLLQDDIPDRIQRIKKKYGMSRQRFLNHKVEITSRMSSYDIPKKLSQLETPYTDRNCLDTAIATNMIAVGMDVDRLGLMVVTGQPKQNSEYIQATSRIGRSYPGLVGLNFVGNAAYADEATEADKDLIQVAQYEFIPWILTQCASVAEARRMLSNMKLMGTPFSEQLPTAQLHWMIADKEECIVVESMKDGMHIYDDPVGVLTNNPPFPGQMFALNNYAGVSRKQPESTFAGVLELDPYSRGMGGMGIPGDLSSQSRFVKVAFTKLNAISGDGENESVSQFFHILGSVDQQRGCCEVSEGAYEITIYTSCCNTTKGIYYYTTYDNHQITAVDMYAENLDSDKLIRYPIILNGEIRWHNK